LLTLVTLQERPWRITYHTEVLNKPDWAFFKPQISRKQILRGLTFVFISFYLLLQKRRSPSKKKLIVFFILLIDCQNSQPDKKIDGISTTDKKPFQTLLKTFFWFSKIKTKVCFGQIVYICVVPLVID